jgi:hypothetical protein
VLFHRKVAWSRAKEAQEPLLMMIAAVKSPHMLSSFSFPGDEFRPSESNPDALVVAIRDKVRGRWRRRRSTGMNLLSFPARALWTCPTFHRLIGPQ